MSEPRRVKVADYSGGKLSASSSAEVATWVGPWVEYVEAAPVEAELARLRKIEAAAWEVIERSPDPWEPIEALREALDRCACGSHKAAVNE